MIRILGFSSIPVDVEASGGAERIAHLYRHLSPGQYRKKLITLTGMRQKRQTVTLPGDVKVVKIPSLPQTLFYYLQAMRILPFFEVSRAHRACAPGIGPHFKGDFDLVQFDSLWLTPWASRIPADRPVIYGSHNYETDWFEGELRRYLFRNFHRRTLFELEREAAHRADHVIAVTEEDREKLAGNTGIDIGKITVIPNGYDDTVLAPVTEEERRQARRALNLPMEGRIALFTGSDVMPNVEAAESITGVIAPHASPGITFVIAGSVGRALSGSAPPNCIVTGRVPDMAPWLRAADVGLNPIRLGSGSNIKVLQYLGSGLPVVSTEFGMRGFEDLKKYVSIKRIDLFYRPIESIQPDPAAAEKVREKYAWSRASAKLASVYSQLLGVDQRKSGCPGEDEVK